MLAGLSGRLVGKKENDMAVKLKGKLVSIVINNEFIKICEMTKNGKSIVIHKAITVETPDGCYSDGVIIDRGRIEKCIKVVLDDNRISTTDVVFSIASSKIASKEVVIPDVRESKIESIINANAAEYFPVNIDEHIINYVVLEHFTEDNIKKIKLTAVAAPTQMVSAYYDMASSLGLKVVSIDSAGNSTHQVLQGQIDEKLSVVIQIENDSTTVNIFSNNTLQLQRTIPYGKTVLVNAVMSGTELEYDVALEKLETESMLHERFDDDNITNSLKYLVSNVNRIVDYYVSRNTTRMIEKAYIVGNATNIIGLETLFANELNYPLKSIDHINNVSLDKKSCVEEKMVTSYLINVGALINPINLVPQAVSGNEESKSNNRFFALLLTISVLGAAALIAVPGFELLSVKANRDTLQANVDRIKDIENVVNDYYTAKDMATDAGAFEKLTYNNNDSLQDFVSELEAKIPSDVVFRSMNVDSGKVTVSGTAASKSSVAKLIQQLQAINSVANVKVASESESKDNTGAVTVTFSLTCSFAEVESK